MTDKNALKSFLNTTNQELEYILETIKEDNLESAAHLILECEEHNGRIHITGVGKPGHVAAYIASLFSSTGTPTYELHATEAIHGSSGQVKAGDVVIAISNSGTTKELLYTCKTLKTNGAKIIAVTGNDQSELAKLADVVLVASVTKEGDELNKPPRNSILAEVIVLQSLSIVLQDKKKLDMKTYIQWHPGGAIGETKL